MPNYLTHPPRHLAYDAIGRVAETQELLDVLSKTKRPIAVVGIGGIGKTTFVQMFLEQHSQNFDALVYVNAGAIFTHDVNRYADNAQMFLEAFILNVELKSNLNITSDPQETPIEQFEKVIMALNQHTGNNLLVIDNASNAAKAYMERLSTLRDWRILITTRDDISGFKLFDLNALLPSEVATVFQNIYGKTSETALLDKILRGIGYHTLTTELLAAYAHEKNMTLNALDDTLHTDHLSHFDATAISTPDARTETSFNNHLRNRFFLYLSDDEKEIMRYLSILPPDGAEIDPETMTEDYLCIYFGKSDTPDIFHNTLKSLVKLHWVINRGEAFALHPVIQETTFQQLMPDAENCAILVKNIIYCFMPDKTTNEPIINRANFAPLGESILRGVYKKDQNFMNEDLEVANLAGWLSNLFNNLGQLYKAFDNDSKALAIQEKALPPEHLNLAVSYNNLATTYSALGQNDKRLEYNKKALAIWEKVLPLEHLNLAVSYNNLAETYGALKQHDKRLAYHQKALAIREKVLPPDHPNLATSYNNLAVTYEALGQNDKSLEYTQKALTIWEKVLPLDHPNLAMSYNNLAETYGASNQHDKRLEYNQKAFAIWEKVLPPDHPDLAMSYNNLAATYEALGQNDESLKYNLKALTIREKVLPPDHPSLATSYNNLALTHHNLGNIPLAIEFMQKAVIIREKALPPEHPSLLNSKKSLATLEKILSANEIQITSVLKDEV
jgi:tetratricopeptide (TPR) repeat protein